MSSAKPTCWVEEMTIRDAPKMPSTASNPITTAMANPRERLRNIVDMRLVVERDRFIRPGDGQSNAHQPPRSLRQGLVAQIAARKVIGEHRFGRAAGQHRGLRELDGVTRPAAQCPGAVAAGRSHADAGVADRAG